MRIADVCSLYRPHAGGIETMVEELGSQLGQQGHEVTVMAKRWPADLPEREVIDDVPIVRVPTATEPAEYVDLARALQPVAADLEADAMHVIGVRRPLPLFALMVARARGIPVIATVAGSEVPDLHDRSNDWVWQAGERYLRPSFTQFDVVNAVSGAIAENTLAAVPELDEVPVMPVGIDARHYGNIAPSTRFAEPYVFALRRLHYSKGIDVLVDAMATTDERVQLVVAGDGPERSNLEAQAASLGIADRVHFLGRVGLDEGIGMLKSAAMTVVPSRSEGGGLVNTTANAVGCPLIATDVGGIREYTTPQASILIPSGSVGALAEAISYTLNDAAATAERTRAGLANAATLSWERLVHRYIRMYETAIDAAASQPKRFEPWSDEVKKLYEIVANER
jgi:glycosyltransferase involved in cell wall biosynthesis